jgi:sugar phosphate isomerase/epimerase
MSEFTLDRRSFLATAGLGSLATAFGKYKNVPVGVELYSVRQQMQADPFATVKEVSKLGYAGVEFYGPYFGWSLDQIKQMRQLLNDVGLKCFSTHNGPNSFAPENVAKAIEYNNILGAKFVVMASAGRVADLDGWKKVAESLNKAQEQFKGAGLAAGFHNHQIEFRPLDGGTRPIELLAKETSKDVVLQLDVGTCVEVGYDPAQWIRQNPGRIKSVHCKEYSKETGKGYRVLFGEGSSPWPKIFEAAESVGGVEHYLIEQEGAEVPPMEAIAKCLENFKKMRG